MARSLSTVCRSAAIWLSLFVAIAGLFCVAHAEIHASTSIGYYRQLPSGDYQVREDWLQDRDGLDVGYCQNIYQRNFAMWELHQCWVYDNEEIAQFYPDLNITYGGVQYQRLLAMPSDVFTSKQLPKYPIIQTDLDTAGSVNYKPSVVQGKTVDNAVYYKFITPVNCALYVNVKLNQEGERVVQAAKQNADGSVSDELLLDGQGALDVVTVMNTAKNEIVKLLKPFTRVDHQSYTVVIDRSKPNVDRVTLRFRVRGSDVTSGILNNVTSLVPLSYDSEKLSTLFGETMFERTTTTDGQIFVSFYPRKLVTGMYPVHFVAYPKCVTGAECLAVSHAIKIQVIRTCYQEGLIPDGNDCKARPPPSVPTCPENYAVDVNSTTCVPTVCFLSSLPTRNTIPAQFANNNTFPVGTELNGFECRDWGLTSRGAQWVANCGYWQKLTAWGCENCTAGQLQTSTDEWSCFAPTTASKPEGNVTSWSCDAISGWALDRNYPEGEGVIVEIWANGPRGIGQFVTTVQAEPHGSVANGSIAGSWRWELPADFSSVNGTSTNFFIFAQDDVFSSWDVQIHPANQLEMLCFFVQDCVVSNWTEWTNCSVPCNGGFQTRTREVLVPAIGVGAGSCPDDLAQARQCNNDPCQDCVMSPWSEFSACSQGCPSTSVPHAYGTMGRSRTVLVAPGPGGKPCPTQTVDVQLCNYPGECDGIEGPWNRTVDKCYTSAWDLWGQCSTDCNRPSELGRQTRYRSVVQPQEPIPKDFRYDTCPPLVESRSGCRAPYWCDREQPIDCVVSGWGYFSDCTEECLTKNDTNGGWMYRQRTIVTAPSPGGSTCPELVEWRPCNRYRCRECIVSNWTYGECSTLCGGGVQRATREIVQPAQGDNECPVLEAYFECNTQACVPQECVVGNWTEWSTCTAKCDGKSNIAYGYTLSTRPILVEPLHGGVRCPVLYQEAGCSIPCVINDPCASVQCPANALGCNNGTCICPNFYGGPNCDVPPSLSLDRVSLPANQIFYLGNRVFIRWNAGGQLPSVAIYLSHPGWTWPVYVLRAAPNTGDMFWKLPNVVELYRLQQINGLNPSYFFSTNQFASLKYMVPSLENIFTSELSSALAMNLNYPPDMPTPDAKYTITVAWNNQIRDVSPGFTFADGCSGVVCANGGTCKNGLCSCINGYSGVYCTTSPCNSNTCGVTGHGICVSPPLVPGQPSPMICQCSDGYNGTRCDQPPSCPPCAHGLITDPSTCKCNCSVDFSGSAVPKVWSGDTCATCTLFCNSVDQYAVADSDCATCVCSPPTGTFGYAGQYCNQAYQKITVLLLVTIESVSSVRDRNMFVDLFARDVAFTLNVSANRIVLANLRAHETEVTRSWADILLLDPLSTPEEPAAPGQPDATALYNTLRAELASNSSLLWNGYASSRTDTNYLPPPPNPPPTKVDPESATSTPTYAIVLIVLGIAAALGVAGYLYKKRQAEAGKTQKKKVVSDELEDEEEMEEVDEEAGEGGEEETGEGAEAEEEVEEEEQ